MKKQKILLNATSSVIQILITSVTLFLLYKYLLRAIGPENLGIWSLVLATTSIAQLANLGITGSIVKYVAKYRAIGQDNKLSLLIQTSIITIATFFLLLMVVVYPLADYYLRLTIRGASYYAAHSILPYALVAFWIMMVTGIYQAGLYGCQMITHRNLILAGESVSFLVICMFLAPLYGLIGLAYARVIQNVITLFVTWCVLKRSVPALPLIPFRWEKSLFKEMVSYSVNLQLISIVVMLCDPVTKGLLSRYVSISMVGYYEMANRMVQQVRSIIVNANQVLVPAFAHLKELEPEKIQTMYLNSYRLLFFVAVPTFSILAVSSPFISQIWVGKYENAFVYSAIILSIGWLLNTLCVPAYFASLGTGELKWNLISHVVMGLSNLGIGIAAGISFSGLGVVGAWALSLALGGIILIIAYHVINGLPMKELLPRTSRLLLVSCFVGVLLCYVIFVVGHSLNKPVLSSGIVILCFAITIAVPVWIHPLRKEIMGWIASIKFNKVFAE